MAKLGRAITGDTLTTKADGLKLAQPRVPYRETISKITKVKYKYKKQ